MLTLAVQENPQKEKISAAQQKMVAIVNSINDFRVPICKKNAFKFSFSIKKIHKFEIQMRLGKNEEFVYVFPLKKVKLFLLSFETVHRGQKGIFDSFSKMIFK